MAARPKSTPKPTPPKAAPAPAPLAKCDNHPERNASLSTTSNGAHQEIHLCPVCIPPHWR